jgi:hypothetical protein
MALSIGKASGDGRAGWGRFLHDAPAGMGGAEL